MILEEIGEGDNALLCITHLTACCRSSDNGGNEFVFGNWFFPNGTRVPSDTVNVSGTNEQWDFYRDRGHMVVRLNRRRGGEEGIYCCMIPDTMNVMQTIYIGVYSINTGEWCMWSIFLCSYSAER